MGTLPAQFPTCLTKTPGICSKLPGRQLVIWHESDDGDGGSPDIETLYYHIDIESYTTLRVNCSADSPEGRNQIWQNARNNPSTSPCVTNIASKIGIVDLIGFTTGIHLHYEVSIDANANGTFENDHVCPDLDGERINPSLSEDIHPLPANETHNIPTC